MRMDKLTTNFRRHWRMPNRWPSARDNQYIERCHLMAALLDQQGGTARPLLEKAGAQVAKLRSDLAGALDRLPNVEGSGGEVLARQRPQQLLNVTDKLRSSAATSYFERTIRASRLR